MTHRDDQIAAAAAALDEMLAARDLWLDGLLPDAEAIVDAVLPQIHTEADFTALYRQGHLDTLLIDRDGDAWRLHEASLRVLHQHGPLTIVWQPS